MMPSVRSLFFVLLAAVSVLAAPVLKERLRSVNVCGVRFKTGDVRDKAPLNSVYSLENKSDVNKETKSKVSASHGLSHHRTFLISDMKNDVKKDYAVDHVVEVQVLQKVADSSKLCGVLNKMHDADKSKTQKSMLQPAFDTLNSSPNLFFLTKKVQSRKKTVTQKVLKGKKQDSKDMDKAVGNYLKQVGSSGTTVASLLDEELADIISIAKGVASKASKDKADKLNKAIGAYQSSTTVSSMWSKELLAL
ncbi:uncharacterized protein PHACADRAFT_187139 [Phanerochaete carnosa HHB-10118-sp]|uniref:Secreted RxLR effector peptide protein n=1 Tax=Phanerochaete carnosa (strain HHB-10118-sp) TaxID=650164 RepID=K5VK21_PHACS|nr:uncharacterized protein PHACADRAFT_187139 [Phanerochaete carnosa HHB-10118-sp]EKM51718.1 hypothetical protein PHACADRAFT_187139 [Phanerochaete carnosa HHB-10118-sp]